MLAGGHSAPLTDAEGLTRISGFKSVIEAHTGTSYAVFEPISYTQQVVAGMNYKSKIRVGDGAFIHVKVHVPLPHTGNPPHVMEHSSGHHEADAY